MAGVGRGRGVRGGRRLGAADRRCGRSARRRTGPTGRISVPVGGQRAARRRRPVGDLGPGGPRPQRPGDARRAAEHRHVRHAVGPAGRRARPPSRVRPHRGRRRHARRRPGRRVGQPAHPAPPYRPGRSPAAPRTARSAPGAAAGHGGDPTRRDSADQVRGPRCADVRRRPDRHRQRGRPRRVRVAGERDVHRGGGSRPGHDPADRRRRERGRCRGHTPKSVGGRLRDPRRDHRARRRPAARPALGRSAVHLGRRAAAPGGAPTAPGSAGGGHRRTGHQRTGRAGPVASRGCVRERVGHRRRGGGLRVREDEARTGPRAGRRPAGPVRPTSRGRRRGDRLRGAAQGAGRSTGRRGAGDWSRSFLG